MKNRFWTILMSGGTELTELWLGVCHLAWGLWVLSPHWDAFSLPVYSAFTTLAPPFMWGVVSTVVGVLTIAGTLCVSCPKNSFIFRRITLFANIAVWATITMAFWMAPAVNSGQTTYFLLTLLSVWLFIRVRFRGNETL